MKKHGFTLAEVLVTLGIIGVVSALVLPTFTASVQSRKIGPKVGKAVASFEQATKALLVDNDADSLTGAHINTPTNLMSALADHMKGAVDSTNSSVFNSADGMSYIILTTNANFPSSGALPHQDPLTSKNNTKDAFIIDIDGINSGVNATGRDQFYFKLMNDGSLVPWGTTRNGDTGDNIWSSKKACPKPTVGTVVNANKCAGHVMENGLKAEYKF